jgi:hypothetical protein
MGTASDDGGAAERDKGAALPTSGRAPGAPAEGLAWSLRDKGRAVAATECAEPPCAWSTGPADEEQRRAVGGEPPPAGRPPPGGQGGSGDGGAGAEDAKSFAQPKPIDSARGPESEMRAAAAEDTAESRSLFAKIVDLVTPPSSAPQPAADAAENQAAAADGAMQEIDSGANVSDGARNTTSSIPSEQKAHERAEANATKDGQAASAGQGTGAGSPIEIELGAEGQESDVLPDELLEPVHIGPDIFPELFPSIQETGDACSGKCTINTCSGHGICSPPLCQCNCTTHYTGLYCNERVSSITHFTITPPPKPCPDNCTGQGDCLYNGTCSCYKGWAGYNCSIECMGGVANPCSGHGVCLQTSGKCFCSEGYAGKNCTRRAVPQDFDNYRQMVLLSESKEREAKEAKENASKVEKERGAGGGAGGEQAGDAGKKTDWAVNASAAEVLAGASSANQTANASLVGAEDAGNSSAANASAAMSAEAEKGADGAEELSNISMGCRSEQLVPQGCGGVE